MRVASAISLGALALSCHGGKSQPAPAVDSGGSTSASREAGPSATLPPARFSRPLAAAHGKSGLTYVAGLVVPSSVIAVTALAADGTTRWTRDAITGVSWSANATLTAIPTPRGGIVVWHGPRAGQDVTVAAHLDESGTLLDEAFTIGAAACATDAELAWAERGTKGTWLVKARAFGLPAQVTALALPEDRDPVVLCTPHRIFAFGDGDDDVTLTSWGQGVRAPALRVMEDVEFGSDEERGHEVYAVGEVVGIVRYGGSGGVAAREVSGEKRSAWRRFGKKLAEGDDVLLVDADARTALLAYTHDVSGLEDPAGAASATSVMALGWDRTEVRDWTHELAPADPLHGRGPFWSGAVASGLVVGWAERASHDDAGGAPIEGMAYRVVSGETVGELKRVALAADELVDAGCDDARCYAVALERKAGEDGGQPEVAEVVAYP